MEIASKFLGGMIGSAIGDAVGELAFRFSGKDQLLAQLDQEPELSYTDDTAMAIGLAESIIKEGRIDQNHLGERFRRNFEKEPWRGYASGPPAIFSMVRRFQVSYPEAARRLFGRSGSLGNGAAMRVVPVGLFFYNAPDLRDQACISAEVTHTHPIGMDGAAIQARAIAQAVRMDPKAPFPMNDFMQDLNDFSETSEIREKMVTVQDAISGGLSPHETAARIGRSVAVHESMPFAVYAFLRNARSFEACLLCAVLNGGDRDTLGAMACAISGAYLGIDAIPRPWRDKLENRTYIECLARKLANMAEQR